MAANLSPESIVVMAPDQLSVDEGEESIILNMKNDVYYGLDGVGAHVWHMLRKPHRIAELRAAVLEEFDVEPERCERDLMALLQRLLAEGLIEQQDGAAA